MLTTVSQRTPLCNRSQAVGATVTCLFGSNQPRSSNTATLVLYSLKTKMIVLTCNLKLLPTTYPLLPPVQILALFQNHSDHSLLRLCPFCSDYEFEQNCRETDSNDDVIKSQISERCWS